VPLGGHERRGIDRPLGIMVGERGLAGRFMGVPERPKVELGVRPAKGQGLWGAGVFGGQWARLGEPGDLGGLG
jgi:hypothetical protein